MYIERIYVTQRKLRNPVQVASMMEVLDELPPIILVEIEDGSVEVQDGHHRCLAYWLSGRRELERGEYILVQKERSYKRRFGKIADLLDRSNTT